MNKIAISGIFFCFLFLGIAQDAESYFEPLKFRNIGPFRGGRSVSAVGVPSNPLTYYMGTTGGGLWKTTDAGQKWSNISDGFFETGSVGAVAVSPSSPNIVYCGMGEHAPRGVMTSYGDGVYKSLDSGKTWKKVGLTKTQHISRILIDPTNPDIVYVAAQGALYGPNEDRGVFKTTDGGETWEKVLFVNSLTGCSELSMDANSPETLYAAMWEHQRKPNKVISGGNGSGLYKSVDGGKNWFQIHNGLPKEKGKMAIAVSAANSDKVFALIESDTNKDQGGLFVSNNGGDSWEMVSGDNRLVQRAWYYIEVFLDPNNENVVYVLSASAYRSIDGGKTWKEITGTHGDYHDLWINPNNSDNMIIADDGGAAISFDFAKNWSRQDNMPTAQFYRINTDNLFPYNIYGGQQDNTSVKIASLSVGRGSISQQDWTYAAGGESAFLAFDPDNPRYVMGGNYLGTIEILDMETKAETKIMAAPIQYLGRAARDMKYLYNWSAPIIWSKHEPDTFYHCAQMVLRTRDKGLNWEEISPDLTRNIDEKQGLGGGPYTNEAVGAENYGTIAYIIESPLEKGVLWTGSDDGLVHITKNGGETWENVTPKGLEECLINSIEISPHDPATAYIATTRYKFNDYRPGLYKTTNYGKSWQKISEGIPEGSFTRVIREDVVRKNLLYAGTEKGLYVSFNAGQSWEPLQLNLPITPITDLKLHQGDLIVATSGRSFWILDDLDPLQEYNFKQNELYLSVTKKTYNGTWRSPMTENSDSFDGKDSFEGINPANGIALFYNLPEIADSTEVVLRIEDGQGREIRRFSSIPDSDYKPNNGGGPPPAPKLSKMKGLNRFVWDMRHPILPGIPDTYIEADFRGHKAPPGTYKFSLMVGDIAVSAEGEIVQTPGWNLPKQQYSEHDIFMSEMEENLTEMHQLTNRLYDVNEQLNQLLGNLKDSETKQKGIALAKELKSWDEKMIQRKSKAYDDVENFPNKFTAEYLFLMNQTDSPIPILNTSNIERRQVLDQQWNNLRKEAMSFLNSGIPEFNKKLWDLGIGAIRY